MRFRVVCGFGETMETLRPTSVFTSVDLPAFGRPTIATNPARKAMHKLYAPFRRPSTRPRQLHSRFSQAHFLAPPPHDIAQAFRAIRVPAHFAAKSGGLCRRH